MRTAIRLTMGLSALAANVCTALARQSEGQTDQPSSGRVAPESRVAKPGEPASRPVTYKFDLFGEHDFKSKLDGPGDSSVSRLGGAFSLGIPIGAENLLSLSIKGERSLYTFSDATSLAPGFKEPFDDTYQASLGGRIFIRQGERWGWFVGGEATSAMEDGAKFSESLLYNGYAGVRYFFSRTLAFSAGIGATTRFEDGVLPIPFLGIDWKFAEKWRLSSDPGLGLKLEFEPSPGLTLSVDTAYELRQYRLDDHGFAPDGAVSDQRVPVAVGVEWKLADHITLSARGGAYVWQRYKIRDFNGVQLSSSDSNPQGFVMLGVRFDF